MTKKKSEIAVQCPWCERKAMLADKTADIRVSCQCPFCGKFYKIDFSTMQTAKIRAKPRKTYRQK